MQCNFPFFFRNFFILYFPVAYMGLNLTLKLHFSLDTSSSAVYDATHSHELSETPAHSRAEPARAARESLVRLFVLRQQREGRPTFRVLVEPHKLPPGIKCMLLNGQAISPKHGIVNLMKHY